jgi:hypothetical protein
VTGAEGAVVLIVVLIAGKTAEKEEQVMVIAVTTIETGGALRTWRESGTVLSVVLTIFEHASVPGVYPDERMRLVIFHPLRTPFLKVKTTIRRILVYH